jgi:DNA polymerase-3 subunit gamma/tau
MAYTALYRKWRPKSFPEVVGQEAVVQTLTNQVKSERVGHAYLFCGTRGTGKTTIAKIFARAVNCEHPVEGSPCNECPSCKAILEGSSMNVVEIDAASNNSVDNIREIRDEVKYSPTEGRYRVYIIDEVHMLSTGAYNALLKTLEEPPSYVIFILATTEVHKIPVTVLSRCQRYDFKRIGAAQILGQLQKLTQAEGIEAEEKALKYVARAADGAMRDALSILEECVSYYYGQTLTYENVLEVVGAVDTSIFTALLKNILDCDVTAAMRLIGELVYSGRDITQTVGDFVWFLRNLMLIQTSEVTEDELGMSAENYEQHKRMAMAVSLDDLMRYIRAFSELQNSMRYATDKRTLLELAVIRAMRPETERDFTGLISRVRALEQTVQKLAAGGTIKAEQMPAEQHAPEQETSEPVKEIRLAPAVYDDLEELTKHWNEIRSACGGGVGGFLEGTMPTYRDEIGFIVPFGNDFNMGQIARPEWLEILETAATKILNKEIHFKLMHLSQLDTSVVLVKSDAAQPHEGVGISIGEE